MDGAGGGAIVRKIGEMESVGRGAGRLVDMIQLCWVMWWDGRGETRGRSRRKKTGRPRVMTFSEGRGNERLYCGDRYGGKGG